MENNDFVKLKHMLDSTEAILSFTKGKRRASLDKDRLLLSAILRELEIIGEAAARISDKTKKQLPNIPWKDLIGMRNRLIHAYFDVDHDIVWNTINPTCPYLVRELSETYEIQDSRRSQGDSPWQGEKRSRLCVAASLFGQ